MKNKFAPRRFLINAFVANLLLVGTLAFGPDSIHAAPGDNPAPLAAKIVAQPITLAQALAMPQVPDDAPWAKQINAFQDADRKQAPPRDAVLFIGSSSIRLWDTLAQDFPEIPVINRGFGGSFLTHSVKYADRIAIPYQPKIVVLFAGTNDLANIKQPQDVAQDFEEFAAKIHAALPDTRVVYLAVNPTVARWKNEAKVLETNYLIQKYILLHNAPDNKLTYISGHDGLLSFDGKPQADLLRADGLHLNTEGYKVWKSIIRERLIPLVATDGVPRLDAPATD